MTINFLFEFIYILSCIFIFKNIISVLFKILSKIPKPIKLLKTEKVLLYLAISYFITYSLKII